MIEEAGNYNEFAKVYDLFMEDVDYKSWCRYIESIFEIYRIKPKKILDTACGTGNITIPMSLSGYEMWGIDLSAEMLSIAENKARASKQKIKFLNLNMIHMDFGEKFEAVLCMCDGVNYIHCKEDLESYFKAVNKSLRENGVFIFDISSYYKLRFVLGSNTFYDVKNNSHYIWNNNFDEIYETAEMDLVFFLPEGEMYRKYEEHHVQKAHKEEHISKILEGSGFDDIKAYKGFTFKEPDQNCERIFFAARKAGGNS